ncbi:MAG: hypothetical protein HC771_25060 [Synechococcales cyanobacterium CRU_2_2]|nr:hypothetical protein [Synechococcales cyanobacterium CRU_2_2]
MKSSPVGFANSTPDLAIQSPTKLKRPGELLQLSSGSGLGLAIVRQIVEAHQGKVAAANHPDTGGAWMTIFLPIKQPDFL